MNIPNVWDLNVTVFVWNRVKNRLRFLLHSQGAACLCALGRDFRAFYMEYRLNRVQSGPVFSSDMYLLGQRVLPRLTIGGILQFFLDILYGKYISVCYIVFHSIFDTALVWAMLFSLYFFILSVGIFNVHLKVLTMRHIFSVLPICKLSFSFFWWLLDKIFPFFSCGVFCLLNRACHCGAMTRTMTSVWCYCTFFQRSMLILYPF